MKVKAFLSLVTECDEPTSVDISSPFLAEFTSDAVVGDDLTSDVSNLEFPDDVINGKICGPIRVIFLVTNDGENLQGQTSSSMQVNVTCNQSLDTVGDVKLEVTYGSSDIPVIQVGDKNPFGENTEIAVDTGSCYMPKVMACLYCGFEFDNGTVGLDDDTWNTISTVEVG